MMDRLQYEVFVRLWTIWHIRLPGLKVFQKWEPPYSDPDLFTPEETEMLKREFPSKGQYRRWGGSPRPWWHLCCNGDAGGWRTALCDYLEQKWRYTKYYDRPFLSADHPGSSAEGE